MSNAYDSWEKFLNPGLLKSNLIQCSLFISGYEILKNSVKDRLHSFYASKITFGEDESDIKYELNAEYKKKVLSLYPKDEFQACCLWFQNHDALDEQDLEIISSIRQHRNFIAHEITKVISSNKYFVDYKIVENLIEVVRKIDIWWIKEVEVHTNPDFDFEDYEKIDWENVIGGNFLILNLIMSVFHGNDDYLKSLHKGFKSFHGN